IGVAGWNYRGRGQTVSLGPLDVVQHVNDMRSADRCRIVNTGICKTRNFAQLFCAQPGDLDHVGLGSKLQATGGTRLDARRFETLAYTIGTKRALVNLVRLWMKLRNIERTARDAVTTTDA